MVWQINVGQSKLKFFQSKGMAREMGHVLDGLEKVTLVFDYAVVTEKPVEEEEGRTK